MSSDSSQNTSENEDDQKAVGAAVDEKPNKEGLSLSPKAAVAGAVAAAIAAVAAFYLIIQVEETFQVSEELDERMAEVLINPSAALQAEYDADKLAADQKNHALVFAGTAALLGFFIVPAMALTSRASAVRILAGLISGTVIGIMSGGAAGFVGMTIADKLELTEKIDPILETIIVHGTIWSLVAIGVIFGVSVATGMKQTFGRALLGGVVGAIVGAALFPVLAAAIFMGLTNSTLPGESAEHGMRTFFLILPSVTIAIGLSCAISAADGNEAANS